MLTQNKTLYGGLWSLERELRRESWNGARYTILLDENTFQHCLPTLVSRVEPLQEAEFIEVPAGEECKTLEVAAQVWQTLLDNGADRDAVLLCLGGGSVCDLGGYVAAGYKRGIRHILVPTTLLAMTDAALGSKTAIDFGGIKNSIGHFYPATLTVIDPTFLQTLPQEQLHCGMMEMVKTAAVTDPALYEQLVSSSEITVSRIKEVARMKERVVKADPYDHGIRRILNFGHTFGHAVEIYSNMPHGLAVGVGMLATMYLSARKTGLTENIYLSYSKWLRQFVNVPSYSLKDIEHLLTLMHQDKKNAGAEVRCVLLQSLGASIIDVSVTDNEIRDTFLTIGHPRA